MARIIMPGENGNLPRRKLPRKVRTLPAPAVKIECHGEQCRKLLSEMCCKLGECLGCVKAG